MPPGSSAFSTATAAGLRVGVVRNPLCPARPPLAGGLLLVLVLGKLAAHFVVTLTSPYGIHRDEFLYLSMGHYLELWRMFFPPGIALLAEAARGLFGDTLFAIRFFPAVAGAALVGLTMLATRELGGGRFAQGLAGLIVLTNGLFLRTATLFQPVVFDQLWWTLGGYALIRLAGGGSRRWWFVLGAAGGLGLLNKFSIAFFGFGVGVAFLLTPWRKTLLTPWPWLAGALAAGLGSPSVVGQLRLGVPVLGHMRTLQEQQLHRLSALDFLSGQLLMFGPALVVALVGLVRLLRRPATNPFPVVGWAMLVPFVTLFALHGKAYYAGPIFPVLFAAGAVAFDPPVRGWGRAGRGLLYGLIAGFAAFALPFGLPVLPPEAMARWSARLGVTGAVTSNRGEVLPLPQDYADMLGWEEMVRAVAKAYHALPAEQQAQAIVLAANYGEAGAIDFYGPRLGLPRAVCTSGGYWYFGPGDRPGRVAVAMGIDEPALLKFFARSRVVGQFDHPWMVPEERRREISVAEEPFRPIHEVWPSIGER